MRLFKKRSFFALLGVICLLLLIIWLWPSKEKVKGNVYTIARDPTWTGQNLLGKDNNILAFSDELLIDIAKEKEFKVNLISASTERLIPGLNNGTYDAILLPIVRKPSLQLSRFLFSQPYFALGPVLVLEEDSTVKNAQELANQSVGIEAGSDLLTKLQKFPSLDIHIFDNVWLGLESLSKDRIDGLIIDAIPAYIYIESLYKGELKILSPALTKAGLKLITQDTTKGEALVAHFNEGLKDLLEDGQYDQLLERWGMPNFPKPYFHQTEVESLEEQESL